MNWKAYTCLLAVLLGIFFFLYGANYYDSVVGWTGVGLFVGGILAYVLLRIFSSDANSESVQKP